MIADRRLVKMRWIKILTIVGAGGTLLIAFAPLFGNSSWIWIMVMYFVANVGLNGAGVFYNALLPHLGEQDELDDISNRAFAYGYLGGGILLVIHLVVLMSTGFAEWAIQFSMVTAGIWWYGFALVTFAWVPEPPVENEMEKLKFRQAARFAVGEVTQTLKDYKDFPHLFLYMLAYFLFIDGINTVTALAGVYGTTVLGIGFTGLIIALLVVQFVAAPSAILFTKLAESKGTKQALMISVCGWVVLCFAGLCFAPLELETHEDYDIYMSGAKRMLHIQFMFLGQQMILLRNWIMKRMNSTNKLGRKNGRTFFLRKLTRMTKIFWNGLGVIQKKNQIWLNF